MKLKIGDIYKPNWGAKCKILMFDERDIFYETLNETNELEFGKRRTVVYTRTTTDFFKSNSTFLLKSDLTKKEETIHRPDLPLRLNCFKETFWTTNKFENIEDFKSFLTKHGIDDTKLENLNTNKIVIYTHSQQSAFKSSVLLENNVGFFSGLVLMFNCFNIQHQYVNPNKLYFSLLGRNSKGRAEKQLTGFGLYRAGIKGKIPSYYLGGHMSLLELGIEQSLMV